MNLNQLVEDPSPWIGDNATVSYGVSCVLLWEKEGNNVGGLA